ncbi:hypothetical protein COO58_11380 [Micromonospora sp. WMMA1996]|uniref:DUF4926 domain-containing protein n=1 Tax=Micromonospora sp. WMMA1996 TaxID=2039878 RepID=UPI000BF32595|nr:DUF4926 domain-containing protein [Micromonospora sp. WMMA1996]PGH44961.1 hypothetical protein COO58_11380 [Micromonospora sp. WMMA1996]
MELQDLVELRAALPGENLPAGAVGTIVHVFHRPEFAYEVEFTDEDGRMISSLLSPRTRSDRPRLPTSDSSTDLGFRRKTCLSPDTGLT